MRISLLIGVTLILAMANDVVRESSASMTLRYVTAAYMDFQASCTKPAQLEGFYFSISWEITTWDQMVIQYWQVRPPFFPYIQDVRRDILIPSYLSFHSLCIMIFRLITDGQKSLCSPFHQRRTISDRRVECVQVGTPLKT